MDVAYTFEATRHNIIHTYTFVLVWVMAKTSSRLTLKTQGLKKQPGPLLLLLLLYFL